MQSSKELNELPLAIGENGLSFDKHTGQQPHQNSFQLGGF